MKKISIIASFILISSSATGQFADKKVKYDEVLPQILDVPSAGIPILLKEFKVENPDEISIDFQLGLVYLDRFLNSDVLSQFAHKDGNARKALEYLSKSRMVIDDKEIRRNEELYFNLGYFDDKGRAVVEFDTVNALMTTYIPILEEFVEKAPPIYENFTQSFSHYDQAHKIYTALIGKYQSYNDLLLLYNEDVDTQFEAMKSEYFEAERFFNKYKELIQAYEIGYNQVWDVHDLSVYRLDGLSAEINFLVDEIEIWNYAKWVDDTRAYIKENIDQLRLDLAREDDRTNQVLEKVESEWRSDEFELLDISKELLFTLRKFDLQSVIESIFLYKEAKHDLLYQELLSRDLENPSEPEAIIDQGRKLYLYGQMITKIVDADTLLGNIQSRNNTINHAKYGDFLGERYNGEQGIMQYVRDERTNNEQNYDRYVSQVRQIIFDTLTVDAIPEPTNYRNLSYPNQISEVPFPEALGSEPITTHRIENFDKSAFIAGVKRVGETMTAYVMGVAPNGRAGWIKEYALSTELSENPIDTRVAVMKPVPGGISLVLNANDLETGEQLNQLMILDGSGEEILNSTLIQTDYPRTLTFVERTNSLVITFKGQDFQKDILQNNVLSISSYSILGDIQWTQSLEGKNDIVDLIPVSDGLILVGNYNEIKGMDENMIRTVGSNTTSRVFLTRLSDRGQIESMKMVEGAPSFFINKTFRVSDECLNLFGSVGNYNPTIETDQSPAFVHVIIDRDLRILSNSMN